MNADRVALHCQPAIGLGKRERRRHQTDAYEDVRGQTTCHLRVVSICASRPLSLLGKRGRMPELWLSRLDEHRRMPQQRGGATRGPRKDVRRVRNEACAQPLEGCRNLRGRLRTAVRIGRPS
jgi:hypothetical protein